MVQSVEPAEAQGGTARFRPVVAPGLLLELGGAAGVESAVAAGAA
jgi:hypothetical protein